MSMGLGFLSGAGSSVVLVGKVGYVDGPGFLAELEAPRSGWAYFIRRHFDPQARWSFLITVSRPFA